MLFSNLVATLLMGVGLLAAWAWKIPTPVQIAVQSPPATKDKAVPEPKTEYIGRITGMIDVKWSDATTAAVTEFVELGRKYALASGMMEITYDSGARVILQGPCTYEAESAAGGYLSVGKLTARLEKKNDELRTEQNDIHPSSFILHPLFSVRTPTATVTDLGTEFGVDVASSGTVETMVLSGSVRVATAELHGNTGAIRVLHTGEAVRVDAREGMTSIEAITVPKDRFVRSIQAFHRSILIGPNIYNGSFEHPAVGPGNSTGSNLSYNVYFKTGEVAPWHWNPVASLQTKGTLVRGVSGWQYVVLQPPTLLLSTTFDGTMGHPTLRKFELHTKYVLSADVGGNIAGVNGIACLENGEHTLRMVFKVTDANLMQPTTLELDTNVHPEFIGNPITVSFTNTTPENQLFIDNVVLMAIPAPATPNEPI